MMWFTLVIVCTLQLCVALFLSRPYPSDWMDPKQRPYTRLDRISAIYKCSLSRRTGHLQKFICTKPSIFASLLLLNCRSKFI